MEKQATFQLKQAKKLVYALLCCFLFLKTGTAQESEKLERFLSIFGISPLHDTVQKEKSGFMFAPILFYTPDTRWSFGGAALNTFRLKSESELESTTRLSYLKFIGIYSLNRQFDTKLSWNVFTPEEKFLIKGNLTFRRFPDRFYGLGNQSLDENLERYAFSELSVKGLFLRKLGKNIFGGVDLIFGNHYNFRYDSIGVLSNNQILGSAGGRYSALGAVFIHDNRDNVLNARKGNFTELTTYYYNQIFGSNFNFFSTQLNVKQFVPISKKQVLAFQTRLSLNSGEVPFLHMATLGGDDILRGYAANRFRDKNAWSAQVEYRFPLFWRFGMTTFVGAGDVFRVHQDLSLSETKIAGGLGFRFLVNTAERINGRIDVSYGSKGFNFYFGVSEAF